MNEEDALVGNTQWREGAGAAQELKMGRTMEAKDNKTMEPELLEELEESQCSTSRLEDDLKQDVCTGCGCVLTKQKAWDQDSHLEVQDTIQRKRLHPTVAGTLNNRAM